MLQKKSEEIRCKVGGIHIRPSPIGATDLEASLGEVDRKNMHV